MKYLIFRKFSFNHIYFLLYAIFVLAQKILKDNLKGDKIAKEFFNIYLVIISRLLSFIPYLIYKKLSKTMREKKENKLKVDIKYMYTNKTKKTKKNTKYSFIVAIFEFIAEIVRSIFYFFNNDFSFSNYQLEIIFIFNTVTVYFGSYFILHYHFYKHHYLSFWVNLACLIAFLIIDIIELIKNKISQYPFYILSFIKLLKLILMSIKDVYSKKVLFENYMSTFTLMLITGLYELLFLAFYTIPFIFIKVKNKPQIIFIDFIEFLRGTQLILSLSILICKFAYALFLLIIIDKFSPSHLPLSFILYSFFDNIYFIIKNAVNHNKNEYYLFINFVFYIILFIASMIHNEIIIINKCGLNTNTKMFLDIKLNEEIKDYILPNDDENIPENRASINENIIPMVEIRP